MYLQAAKENIETTMKSVLSSADSTMARIESSRVNQDNKSKAEDLFSAHDFDIKIDLEVPLPSKIAFQLF